MSKEVLLILGVICIVAGFVGGLYIGENAPEVCTASNAEAENILFKSPEVSKCNCPTCAQRECTDDDRIKFMEEWIDKKLGNLADDEPGDSNVPADDDSNAPRESQVHTGGMFSADAVYAGLTSDDIHLQNTACHYANDYPDDRFIEPLIKILTSPDITKPLPSNHEWAEDYLAFGCINGLVSQWYLDGNSEKAWKATLNYFKTISINNMPQEYRGYGMFSRLTDTLEEAEPGWKEKATYYKPEELAEALIIFIHRGLKDKNIPITKHTLFEDFKIIRHATKAILVHEPRYLKYLIVDPQIPEVVRAELLLSEYNYLHKHNSCNMADDAQKIREDACAFFNEVIAGKKIKDPNLKKLGLPDKFDSNINEQVFSRISYSSALNCQR